MTREERERLIEKAVAAVSKELKGMMKVKVESKIRKSYEENQIVQFDSDEDWREFRFFKKGSRS